MKVNVIIVTKPNNLLTKQDVFKYNKQYNNLKVIYDNSFHDRYFILDGKTVYHCGSSINRIGYKTFSITLIGDMDVCKILINSLVFLYLKKEILYFYCMLYIGDDMRLIKSNSFLKIFLPNLAISYKKVNGKLNISGFYKKVELKMSKKFDL